MNKFYSGKKALSYNTPFIFTLGNRSIGKSFYWQDRAINSFLATKSKFIYMRRYDEDLKKVGKTFFDNVKFKHPNVKFEVKGNGKTGTTYWINGEQAGITVALTTANKLKSIGFADYDTIIFDEFLPEDNVFVPNEVALALGFYQTVARGYGKAIRTDVKFVFIANNVTINNPYFRDLKIRDRIDLSREYTLDSDKAWVVEIINNKAIAEEIANTPFGKMISKTKYGEYALKSQFYLDDNTFISKPKGKSEYYCTLIYNDDKYGVYHYTDEDLLYITRNVDPSSNQIFSLTTKDHKPSYLMLYRNNYNPIFKMLKYAYDNALLRFDSIESKQMFLDFMSFTI